MVRDVKCRGISRYPYNMQEEQQITNMKVHVGWEASTTSIYGESKASTEEEREVGYLYLAWDVLNSIWLWKRSNRTCRRWANKDDAYHRAD